MQTRISDLAYPLFVSNVDLCGKQKIHDLGFNWITVADIEDRYQRLAGIQLGVSNLPYLTRVIPGSAADEAGLIQGDTLLSINGIEVPVGPDHYVARVKPFGEPDQPMYRWDIKWQIKKATKAGAPVTLEYLRGTDRHSVEVKPQLRCNYDVLIYRTNDIGLLSVGNTIFISSSLFDFTQSNSELQMFIAHELAHKLKKHETKNNIGRTLVFGVDLIVSLPLTFAAAVASEGYYEPKELPVNVFAKLGSKAFRQKYELEADYVTAYLLERSGVSSGEVAQTWDRVPSNAVLLKRHVRHPKRGAMMNSAAQEIAKKRQANEPIVPNPT